MFPILLYITLFIWLGSIAQSSLLPYWAGDLVFIILFGWSLHFNRNIEKFKHEIWRYWIPPIFGLGMASYLIFTYWVIVPYLLTAAAFTYLFLRRSKWIFRLKEGLLYCLIIFLIFLAAALAVRFFVMHYNVTIDFYVRFIITFIVSFSVWIYYAASSQGAKIR